MQSRRFSDISMISAIVALFLGFSASAVQATTFECVDNTTVEVCLEWSQGFKPQDGTDFSLTFHGGAGADVELKVGDPEWRLWTTLVSTGAVTSFGDITLDPTANNGEFTVRIFGDLEAGAVDVGSLNLDGTINNADWVGFSSILEGIVTPSRITGDVKGVITLVQKSGSPPTGGEMGHLTIVGNVTGKITIPTLTGMLQIGDLSGGGDVLGGFEIDLLKNRFLTYGTLPANKTGEIGDIDTGGFEIGTVAEDATLDALSGVPGSGQTCKVGNLAGKLDLHNQDIDSNLFLGDVASTGTVVNGGAISAIFYPSFEEGDFAGTATFSSVEAGGSIYAFDGDPIKDTNVSGTITITGDYAGLFKVDGDFTSTALLTINGDLKTSSGEDGLIWVVEEAAGDVHIKGKLIGHVHHPKTFTGSLTVDGDVTSTGLFKTGDRATGETHSGDLTFKQDVLGDILIHGNTSGAVQITDDFSGDLCVDEDLISDLTSGVTVGGALANSGLAGGGRILVSGESSGDIKVGKNTGSLTLIHVVNGLATGATIEINTTEGAFDAEGDILIGHPTEITAISFDGCLRIHDQLISGNNGDLIGSLDVNGCHGDGEVLVICIDGDDNGNVTLDQTGCTPANATWGCEDPPSCP